MFSCCQSAGSGERRVLEESSEVVDAVAEVVDQVIAEPARTPVKATAAAPESPEENPFDQSEVFSPTQELYDAYAYMSEATSAMFSPTIKEPEPS